MPGTRSDTVQVPALRALRVRHVLSQQDLADRAGVGKATIHRAERGGLVSPLTIERLAHALGVTIKQLQESEPTS